jgi:hypothetical protein
MNIYEYTKCFLVLNLRDIRAVYPYVKELDGPEVRALRRTIAEVKQRWSARWVTKNLLSRASPFFGRHAKPLVPAAFAAVSTQPALVIARYPYV